MLATNLKFEWYIIIKMNLLLDTGVSIIDNSIILFRLLCKGNYSYGK